MNWIEQKTLGLFVKTNGLISKPMLAGLGHIFMLHRVLPEPLRCKRSLINRDLAITPDQISFCLEYFIKNDYDFITLDELHDTLVNRLKRKRRFICITLDDGYQDNLEYGLPIFKKYNIPFCIYVTNCFANRNGYMWWYYLEEYMHQHSQLSIDANQFFEWKSDAEKANQFAAIRTAVLKMSKDGIHDFVTKTLKVSIDKIHIDCEAETLSWQEIISLSNEPLATIGAHTMNHLPLAAQNDVVMTDEIFLSKKELEEKIGKPVHHFAYPYGSFSEVGKRECATALDAGFKTAVLNYPGNVFYENGNALHALPRMPLGNNTDVQKLHEILTGINHFSYNGFQKIPLTTQ